MALQNAGVRAFVLAAGEMTGPEQVALFVKLLPVMKRYVRKLRGAFMVRDGLAEFVDVLVRSTLAERRPIGMPEVAAPGAHSYYPHIGMTKHDSCWVTWGKRN